MLLDPETRHLFDPCRTWRVWLHHFKKFFVKGTYLGVFAAGVLRSTVFLIKICTTEFTITTSMAFVVLSCDSLDHVNDDLSMWF